MIRHQVLDICQLINLFDSLPSYCSLLLLYCTMKWLCQSEQISLGT